LGTYIDTSVLVAYYIPEKGSQLAQSYLKTQRNLTLSSLTQLEFVSAINKKVIGRQIKNEDAFKVIKLFRNNIVEKYFKYILFYTQDVITAEKYISDFLGNIGLRTLDALHLAIAYRINCKLFVTADPIQAKVSEKLGIKTTFLRF